MSSTNEDAATVGGRLLLARSSLSLTQPQFADALGLSLRGYQNYERDERGPSEELIRAAWGTFGIDPVWLLTGTGAMLRAATEDAEPAAPRLPGALAGHERRIGALLDVLGKLDPESREAILTDALSRATTAQRLSVLEQAVGSHAEALKKIA